MLLPVTAKKLPRTFLADFALLLVAVFWGSNFVIQKNALELITPFAYLGLRFSLAALLLLLIFRKRVCGAIRQDLGSGCLVGFFLFAGFAFQTVGLLSTTPAKSGFITGTSVVIVPFLCYLVMRVSPGWWSFAGALLAVAGLFLLSSLTSFSSFALGDMLTLISAVMFAAHITALGVYAPRRDPIILTTVQLAFTGAASFVIAFITEPVRNIFMHPPRVWLAILYAIIFCTIGAFITQTVAQRHTPATHAAIILSTESIFAGLFSYLFWNEEFDALKLAGAGLIMAGIIITEVAPLWQRSPAGEAARE